MNNIVYCPLFFICSFVNQIIIYTDGGSRGNPGPAAIGVVITNGIRKSYAEYIGETTNNEAEYRAVIFALKKIKLLYGKSKVKNSEIIIRSDSELLVSQLNGKYKISHPKIAEFFIEVWNLKIDFGKTIFEHIVREKNKEADRLVNDALDKQQGSLF